MIKVTTFSGTKVAVFGLGISGLSAAKALRAGGADVIVWDETPARLDRARELGFEVEDLKLADWASFSCLALSPGVPLTHPEPHWTVQKAQEARVPVIGDTELFFQEFLVRGHRDKVLVITGTNGKSTTTALTTHILKEAGERAVMGGNIGFGVLDLPDFGSETIYVLEMSSYQIDLTLSLAPTGAALLNISPDHIDRHGSVEHYAEVKSRVFDQLDGAGRGIISIDDEYCHAIAARLETHANVMLVGSKGDLPNGARLVDRGFVLYENGVEGKCIDLSTAPSLRGGHNAQNAAFSYLLSTLVSDNHDGLLAGFESFPGLAHRGQVIGRYRGDGDQNLLFVNDSKATNAEASAMALASYDEIYWIVGGQAKTGGIEPLKDAFGSVKKAFLFGESVPDFSQTLQTSGVDFEVCDDVQLATKRAFEVACEQAVGEAAILLSPAAASFDQFKNFEERGQAFSCAVGALGGDVLFKL